MAPNKTPLAPQQITTDVLVEKYAKGDETNVEDIFKRVSAGIAAVEKTEELRSYWADAFYNNMMDGALGAGRIMSAGGSGIEATMINCFVQPVGDCISGLDKAGNPGIYDAIAESAKTMSKGGGVGYNFSCIRPKNAIVNGTQSMASGPCSYMNIFDSSCGTIESAGARRGAQMGILNINHPDIKDFIMAKRTPGRWNNFNVSVFVTDEFMRAKDADEEIHLEHKAKPSDELIANGAFLQENGLWSYSKVKAQDLWDIIMKSNYDYAEPGILFENTINSDNNLRYCETLFATNPCGEQPLPPYGCCDLGPINLTKFVNNPFTIDAMFDMGWFINSVRTHVRFLDNVLTATVWPLEAQRKESNSKRRIGIGFTGLGNTLAMLNLGYNTEEGLGMAKTIAEQMRNNAYLASIDLAKERGSFPLLDLDKYLEEGTFASRLPKYIKEEICKHGIRNSHLLSIAPVGTVSLAFADNASNGIEPPFSLAYTRKKRMPDDTYQEYLVIDHALRVYLSSLDVSYSDNVLDAIIKNKTTFKFEKTEVKLASILPSSLITAQDLNVNDHINMLKVVQPFIDSAISKTVNVPADYPFKDFKDIYDKAYSGNLKGISTYRPNSILGSVLSLSSEPKKDEPALETVTVGEITSTFDPFNNYIEKRPEGTLPAANKKVIYTSNFVEDKFFVGISFLKEVKRPIEVFFTICPDGVPQEWFDNYAINMSMLARGGLNLFCKALRANRKVKSTSQIRYGTFTKPDGTTVPRFHSSEVACMAYAIQEILIEEGVIDVDGFPIKSKLPEENKMWAKLDEMIQDVKASEITSIIPGKLCNDCGAHAVIKKDGCTFCTNCGIVGSCG